MIPVILHYPDYRGSHALDARKVIELESDTPLSYLLDVVERESKHGAAHIEVTRVELR